MTRRATTETSFMRPKVAGPYLGFGQTKLHQLHETDPTFPRKIRLSKRCVGWRKADLDEWLARKAAEARGEATA